MTVAVVGTLSINKQSNKQKETKSTQFQHDGLRVMGSGSIFFNRKPKNGFQGSEKKKNTSLSYQKTPNRSNKDKKNVSSKKFLHSLCFESNHLCMYVHT